MTLALLMPNIAFASDNEPREVFSQEERECGLYDENGYVLSKQDRLAINPDFAPDESCLFDVFQIQCIPGSEQECSKPQFGNNEEYTCFPMTLVDGEWEWECPEDYHSRDDDETGQCYPDSEGCEWPGYIMMKDEDGKGNTCRVLYIICLQEEHKGRDYCIEHCKEFPDSLSCKPIEESTK